MACRKGLTKLSEVVRRTYFLYKLRPKLIPDSQIASIASVVMICTLEEECKWPTYPRGVVVPMKYRNITFD